MHSFTYTYTTDVRSPCIGVCQLDDANLCTGCHRSVDEIAEWGLAGTSRREQIRRNAAERQRLASSQTDILPKP